MGDKKPAQEPIVEDARIDALEKRLKAAREREDDRNRSTHKGVDANYRSGNRVLADLLGGVLGGVAVGWTIDWLFGTTPWGLLACLFLGIGVAFRNIFLAANTRSNGSAREQDESP